MTSTPTSIAVAGSCTTRDSFNSIFNPDYKRFFSCDAAANQTSLISMMSAPVEAEFRGASAELSEYQRWNVASDMSGEFLALVAQVQPEYLIVDFFAEVHFGVLRLEDGRYLTNNRWMLHRTDYYQQGQQAGAFTPIRFQSAPEEYFGLWREAMDRFAAYIAEHCPSTTVIVHRGLNTDRVLVPGEPEPIPMRRHKQLSPLDVPLANQLWARLDDYAIDTFGWASIDLRHEEFTSYAEHPWGAFYVHYTLDYYHRFLAELHKIHLARTADDDLDARLLGIEAAARESGERRIAIRDAVLTDQRETLDRQRHRIDELEGLGIVRSAKFALGQRVRAARAGRQQKSQES